MVCMRVAFHENDGLAEITETTGIRGANHGLTKQRV